MSSINQISESSHIKQTSSDNIPLEDSINQSVKPSKSSMSKNILILIICLCVFGYFITTNQSLKSTIKTQYATLQNIESMLSSQNEEMKTLKEQIKNKDKIIDVTPNNLKEKVYIKNKKETKSKQNELIDFGQISDYKFNREMDNFETEVYKEIKGK